MRSPQVRVIAGAVVATVAVSSFAFSGSGASAANLPNAQSVGRFVDGSIGNSPIQSIADIKDARAVNPGSVSDQNPLDVSLLKTIDLPLTGALNLPSLAGLHLGAVNQVADARSDGYSYGASGAVADNGGASVGGKGGLPADATLDLTGADSQLSALHDLASVKLTIGAISALAQTPVGVDKGSSTSYSIAGLGLDIQSNALAGVLKPVTDQVTTLLSKLSGAAGTSAAAACDPSQITTSLPLLGGSIVLDVDTATLSVNLEKLLQLLGLDLNTLPANTDLLQKLLDYVTDHGLTDGLSNTVDTLTTELTSLLNGCIAGLTGLSILQPLLTIVTNVQKALDPLLSKLGDTLNTALGSNALKPIVELVQKLVDIGVNVQPNGPSGTYTDALKATPAQNTPVVPGQTIVRAVEVNLLGKGGINLALGNAAAGPSNPTVAPPTSSAPPTNTTVPTGVPAGLGTKGGTPALPLILLVVGLVIAGSGVTAQRMRLRRNH